MPYTWEVYDRARSYITEWQQGTAAAAANDITSVMSAVMRMIKVACTGVVVKHRISREIIQARKTQASCESASVGGAT